MKTFLTLLLAATALTLAACRSEPTAFVSQQMTKYSIENTGKFALLDPLAQAAVTCSGLQEKTDEAGRLQVVANVMNRSRDRVAVQVRCVFKDRNGFSTGDETPWSTLVLDDSSTEAVRFAAANNLAHSYTIAVRQAPPPELVRITQAL